MYQVVTTDTSVLTFARLMATCQPFKTHGGLYSKDEFSGLGQYVPFDDIELDELRSAQYVVYSYDTPIAWRTATGAWVKNCNNYSATTSKHQCRIFAAIDDLS